MAFILAKKMMEYNEPIPDFSTRFPNVLERCLLAPFQTFGGKLLYRGLAEKASALFYFLIKDHPFQNGNKRIAFTTLLAFLYKNNKRWLAVDGQEFYNFAVWVAQSPSDFKEEVMISITKFIKRHLVKVASVLK